MFIKFNKFHNFNMITDKLVNISDDNLTLVHKKITWLFTIYCL